MNTEANGSDTSTVLILDAVVKTVKILPLTPFDCEPKPKDKKLEYLPKPGDMEPLVRIANDSEEARIPEHHRKHKRARRRKRKETSMMLGAQFVFDRLAEAGITPSTEFQKDVLMQLTDSFVKSRHKKLKE